MATEYKLSFTASEINEKLGKVDTLASKNEIPTKTSDLTNDSGFITGYTETDPTVPAWAKASTKPTYTASEVGALPDTTEIPNALADLDDDSTHRVVTDAEKAIWNAKANSTHTHTVSDVTNLLLTVDTSIGNHNTSTSAHSDIRDLITELSTAVNNFLDVDDTTTDQLSEVLTLINNNKGTLESLISDKVNVSDIVNNLTTNNASKVLSAAQGVALKGLIDALQSELDSHTHAIADVSGLQNALDGKASTSHGTHVSFDSTNKPKMDGTAAFGTSTNVARADHVHPTETSRASQTSLDSHTGNTTVHITAAERTNWNAAKTHADSAHAPSDAEKNQNAFSNVTVGTTTIAADSTTDTLTLVAGSNVTITPDATNDKITISATDTVYTHPSSHAASMITGLSTVATSGNYNDLIDTPTIPTVNNATLTIQKNGANVATFTANSSTNATANITVPTKTSELTNDSGFKTTDTNTTYTFATGDANGQIKVTPSGGSAQNVSVKGLGSAAYTASTAYDKAGAANTALESAKTYTDEVASGKANTSHTHTIANVSNLQTTLDAKVPTSRTINGKALTSNITLSASDVNAYTKSEIDDYVFITTDDIDTICGTTILNAEEVAF